MTDFSPPDNNSLGEVTKAETRQPLHTVKRLLTLCFFIALPVLLVMLIRNLDWSEVMSSLRGYQLSTLLLGIVIALTSYLVFSSYDLIGRRYTHHQLPRRQVLPVAFVCYAFNINLSSWIGGVAMRYRLYSRLGLSVATITRIISLSVLTNTLGYIIVAGVIFALRLVQLPSSWELSGSALQLIGFALLLIATAYLTACAFSRRRTWSCFNHEIALPSLRLALAQVALSTLNWSLMALLIYLLLPPTASYSTVLGLLLISGIAGMIAQIPAGIGVLEAVFLTLLQRQFSTESIFAALLAYRAIYFLLPLGVASLIYLVLEGRAKKWQRLRASLAERETDDPPALLATAPADCQQAST